MLKCLKRLKRGSTSSIQDEAIKLALLLLSFDMLSNKENDVPKSNEHFEAAKETLASITQTMLEIKKQARSIENMADATRPFANSDLMKQTLQEIVEHSMQAAQGANKIYHLIAREALGT